MTVDELVDKILALVGQNTNEELKNVFKLSVLGKRNYLLKQQLQRYSNRTQFEVSITFNLEESDLSDLCSLDICKVLKATIKIPNSLEFVGVQPYKVSLIDRSEYFDYVKPEQFKYSLYSKYTAKERKYTIINGYLYILNERMIDRISVTLIPDEFDLDDFECLNCKTADLYIPGDMEDAITKMTLNEYKMLSTNDGQIDEDKKTQNI